MAPSLSLRHECSWAEETLSPTNVHSGNPVADSQWIVYRRFSYTFKTRLNLSQETIDSEIQFAKIASKSYCTRKTIGCFTETIGCLYQQTTNKTEFKELEMERLYTVIYTGSLQTQSYIQSSQKPWGNPLSNHTLITYTTNKRMTLNTSRNTLSLVNTLTPRLLILIPSRTHNQS